MPGGEGTHGWGVKVGTHGWGVKVGTHGWGGGVNVHMDGGWGYTLKDENQGEWVKSH